MLAAGRFYLEQQGKSPGVPESDLIRVAVQSLGLSELSPFDPKKKIIEYVLADEAGSKLVDRPVREFIEETASELPAPGGGSVAAALGALGAALATMVANLSSHRRGWDDRWEEFSDWAEKGKACYDELLRLVDDDTDAFNAILDAVRLPGGSEEELTARTAAVMAATESAIEVPLRVMEVSLEAMETIRAMADIGQETSASDAGVAALCARSAVRGAYLNVRINTKDLSDRVAATDFLDRGTEIEKRASDMEQEILGLVDRNL